MPSQSQTSAPDEACGSARRVSPGDLAPLAPMVRIGVTGHRDLADRERACAAATQALGRLLDVLDAARWPAGTLRRTDHAAVRVGYRVVSPLAEGADRVVAALAVSPDGRLSGGPPGRVRELVVPLPFQLGYYRGRDGRPGSDCRDARSQAEFDRLRSAALWAQPLHDAAPADLAQRDAWYRDVGSYVVEHCDFLFALWDGRDNALPGGTAAVVKFALDHATPVIWIPVTRKRAVDPAAPAPEGGEPRLLTHFPEGDGDQATGLALSSPQAEAAILGRRAHRLRAGRPAATVLLERLGRLAELGRYARQDAAVPRAIAREKAAARPAAAAHAAVTSPVADWIIPSYVVADGLAKRYQRALKALNIGVYAAAVAAVTLGAFTAILFPYRGDWRLLVVVEALVLIALFLVQLLDVRRKCRDRWVAFRAMGEYFRAARFLALVYPAESRSLEFDRFAQSSSWSLDADPVPWFAPVIERAWDLRPELHLGGRDVPWLREYLTAQWIDGQISYHLSRQSMHLRWDRIFRRAIWVILLATVLIVAGHVALDYLPRHTPAGHHQDLVPDSLAFLAIALTSLAAAINGYSGLARHNYHYVRFSRMADELGKIKGSLCQATTLEELRAQLGVVRRIMLGETADWYEGMEQQLIESPT